MRRLIGILLVLLLFAGLLGCQPRSVPQESPVDLPIVTRGASTESAAPPATAGSDPAACTSAAPTAEPSAPETEALPETETLPTETEAALGVTEDGVYDSKEELALYIHLYGHLPSNFITKKEAESLGWPGGYLEPYAPGKCIGGSRFGNYEGQLPDAKGRSWTECDVDTLGARSRGAKRIVFSNDGLIYYTGDHYEHFELLYGEED